MSLARAVLAYVLFCGVFISLVSAQTPTSNRNVFSGTLELGLHAFSFEYRELVDPPLKSTESNIIPGGLLIYTTNRAFPLHARLTLGYAAGDTDYDGSTQAGLPLTGTTKSAMITTGLLLRYAVPIGPRWTFIPYAGATMNFWNRDMSGTKGGYQEIYGWISFPLGYAMEVETSPSSSFLFDLSARLMTEGQMTAYLSKISSQVPDVDMDIQPQIGACIEAWYRHAITERYRINFGIYYERTAFEKGEPTTITVGDERYTFYEPSSKTDIIGFKALLEIDL